MTADTAWRHHTPSIRSSSCEPTSTTANCGPEVTSHLWISVPPCGVGRRGRSRAPAPDCQRVRVPPRRRQRARRPISGSAAGGTRLEVARERTVRPITSEPRCARRSMRPPAALCLARETRTVRLISRCSTMPRSESSPMIPDTRVRPTPAMLAREETGTSASTRARAARSRPVAPGMTASTGRL